MPIDERQLRLTFQSLGRQLTKLSHDPCPENVHHLRTHTRRVEVLVTAFTGSTSGNDRKLLKLLSRLRKKAGRIRDLDVQLAALGDLAMNRDGHRKSQLIRRLEEERQTRNVKLAKFLDRERLGEIRKRLKKAAANRTQIDPLDLAIEQLSELGAYDSRLNEKTLHQYRIVGKRSRYLAEVAVQEPRAERLIEALKKLQDAIGDWHDWLKLEQQARKAFAETDDSLLLSTLRRTTAAKFGHAVQVLNETRGTVRGLTVAPIPSARVAPAAKTATAAA